MLNTDNYLAELFCGDDERAEAVVEEIAALPAGQQARLQSELEAALDSPERDRRWWATRALAALPVLEVSALMLRSLGDVDASVRQCAALGLRLHPDAEALPSLLSMLNDEDSLCAELAADALVEIGAPAVPDLLELLSSGGPKARVEAARALALIGDTRAIPALFGVLDEDSALLEYWAEQGLERMGVGMVFFSPD